jgi:pilus assembly protein Flp/PilA
MVQGAGIRGNAQMQMLRRLMKSREGSTAIEYALIGVLISIAIIAGVSNVGGAIGNTYNYIATQALGNGTLATP